MASELLLVVGAVALQTVTASLVAIVPSGTALVKDGTWRLEHDVNSTLHLSGANLSNYSQIGFTHSSSYCDNTMVAAAALFNRSFSTGTFNADAHVRISNADAGGTALYVCLDLDHQGDRPLLRFSVTGGESPDADGNDGGMPTGAKVFCSVILLCLSGLFSGLNLGLMALDTNELEILMKIGSATDKKYASKIHPLRSRGNLLLCSVLLGNVLVNTVLTLLLDQLMGGIYAVVFATLGIVVFGEIIPQAVCSRHGMMVGAHAKPLVLFFMAITFVLAWPISLILDRVLGEEIGTVLNRSHIVELLQVQDAKNDLEREEVQIVTGALTYADRVVADIMTNIEDVYMLNIDAVLDFKTISEIFQKGHSRVPVHDGDRDNIIGVLFVKELAFVDPDDCTELSTIIKSYKHMLDVVDDDIKLNELLEHFIKSRSHLVVVQRIEDPGNGLDRNYKNVGVATLEDIIEEIIQAEIVDETDTVFDNRTKSSVLPVHGNELRLYPEELELGQPVKRNTLLTEQMALAAFTFLATNVQQFSDETLITKPILHKLVNRPECVMMVEAEAGLGSRQLYVEGTPLTHFSLILEGSAKVTVGKEGFTFDAGPFSTLGAATLEGGKSPLADFSAVVQPGKAIILHIPRTLYKDAISSCQIAASGNTPLSERRSLSLLRKAGSRRPSPVGAESGGVVPLFGSPRDDSDGEDSDSAEAPLLQYKQP